MRLTQVTDGMPDQEPNEIVYQATKSSRGHPIHCIFVSDKDVELPTSSRLFLENLALNTRGSFYAVYLTHVGDVKKVKLILNIYCMYVYLSSYLFYTIYIVYIFFGCV